MHEYIFFVALFYFLTSNVHTHLTKINDCVKMYESRTERRKNSLTALLLHMCDYKQTTTTIVSHDNEHNLFMKLRHMKAHQREIRDALNIIL